MQFEVAMFELDVLPLISIDVKNFPSYSIQRRQKQEKVIVTQA